MSADDHGRIWPISLHQIEATVSAYLGPGRVPGNHQSSAFSRQVAMYLAKHVGRWSTTRIGKYYNGRHHTTVLYSIEKIESLRERDASVDALLEMLCKEISVWSEYSQMQTGSTSNRLAATFAERISFPVYRRHASDAEIGESNR
ncbi:MAG: Chromosomal replication initiator, DnaA C-terminal domain [Bryobacterales bacterium]|nr:Chromosomal replication initiator, DnaA C-terminal domain [Bryobacterales bacterium]